MCLTGIEDVIYVGDVFPNLRTNCPSGLTRNKLDRHQILTQGALPGSPNQGLLVNLHYILLLIGSLGHLGEPGISSKQPKRAGSCGISAMYDATQRSSS